MKAISLFQNKKIENIFPQRKIFSSRHYFLYCTSFDLVIPIIKKRVNDLNIFEISILKLLNYKNYTIDELVDIMCLERDLLNLIVLRLDEKGMIDSYHNLTSEGKKQIDDIEKTKNEMTDCYVTIFKTVFDNKEEVLLPYIQIHDNKQYDTTTCSLEAFDKSTAELNLGSAGKKNTIKGNVLNFNRKLVCTTPTNSEVRQLIQQFFKLSNLFDKNAQLEQLQICRELNNMASPSEKVLFHIQGAIQDGNIKNILVSDGFVPSIDMLSQQIEINTKEFEKFRSSNTTLKESKNNTNEKNVVNKNLYSKIKIKERNIQVDTELTSDQKEINSKNFADAIKGIFSDIEWTLHYYYENNNLSNSTLDILKKQTSNENKDLLLDYAHRLEIIDADIKSNLFSRLDNGKITYYLKNKIPVLYTLLPLFICEASENMNSRFYNLKNEMPRFFRFLGDLNQRAQEIRHDVNVTILYDEYERFYRLGKTFIYLLLPDLNDDYLQTNNKNPYTASEIKLNATVSLEAELGALFYQSLNYEVQQQFLLISKDKELDKLPSSIDYILVLSKILEYYFLEQIKFLNIENFISKKEIKDYLKSKWNIELPKSLSTVNEIHLKSALNAKNATLGSYTLVIIYFGDEEIVNTLIENDFIQTIATICELRGHGNNVTLDINLKKLIDLREKVIKYMKVIGE